MGLKEGWTKEKVDLFLRTTKKLQNFAAESGITFLPVWLDDDGFRDYMIEHFMIKHPEMSMEGIDEHIKALKSREGWIELKKEYFDWVLTDPERLWDDVYMEYKKGSPKMSEEEIEKNIKVLVEILTKWALKKQEKNK